MFFHILMEKDLHIYPRHFGPRLKQHLQDELVRKVEGTCSGRYGFIITVTQVLGFESDDEFHSQVPPPHPTPPHPTLHRRKVWGLGGCHLRHCATHKPNSKIKHGG